METVVGNMCSLMSVPSSIALYIALKEDSFLPTPTTKLPLD